MDFIDLHQDIAGAEAHSDLKKQTGFEQLTAAHAKIVFGTGFALPGEDLPAIVERDFAFYEAVCEKQPEWRIVRSASGLQDIVSNPNSRGVVFHIEGLTDLGEGDGLLDTWYARGLRSLGLVWNTDNPYGGGTNSSTGLTSRGAELLEKAESLGILIDLSHANPVMYADMLKAIKRPPFISHGGLAAIVDSPRNFTDGQARSVAEKGGIFGVFFPKSSMSQSGQCTVDDIATHIRSAVDRIGEDAVAIGSDFGGITSGTPDGLASVSDMPRLWEAIRRAGISSTCLEKIAFTNAKRYLSLNLPSTQ